MILETKFRELAPRVFLGGKTNLDVFVEAGRNQLVILLSHGLEPDSRVLDIGCGCLRGGYWIIRFLDPERYFGLEPNREMLEAGIDVMLDGGLAEEKRPRFDYNSDFDFTVFGVKFDFLIARSVWTHASRDQIRLMLDQFLENSTEEGVFLTSYLPATKEEPATPGKDWVGRSHESDEPGVVRYSFDWLDGECRKRGLFINEITNPALNFRAHNWLAVYRQEPEVPRVLRPPDNSLRRRLRQLFK